MPIFTLDKHELALPEFGQIFPLFIRFLLLSSVLAFSHASQALEVEIGSGILDRDKVLGPRWTRVNVDPLLSGENTLRVTSDASADIRFSVFQIIDPPNPDDEVRIGTSTNTSTLAEWTGTLDTAEQYYLGIWSTSGSSSFTAFIEADVIVDPEITSQPADLTVTEGNDAIFAVTATGTGTLTYQWYVNDQLIAGATADTYVVSPTVIGDDGNIYRVDVTDDNATISSDDATLTVEPPVALEIVNQPTGQIVTEGDDASFSVTAVGTGTLGYQWYVNDVVIAGATNDTHVVSPTLLADDGNVYRVEVTDDSGTISSIDATLDVQEIIVVPVTVVTIGQGTVDSEEVAGPRWLRLDFDSLAAASHTIRVSWDSDADVKFKVFEANGTALSSTIRDSNPGVWSGELDANAAYYISLWSSDGIANYNATVEANVPVSIVSQPSDRTVTEGDDVTFYVEASGSGTLAYQWFANGTPIAGETGDSLTIVSASLIENGSLYNVEVGNGFETVSSSAATLTVNEPLALGLFSQGADDSAWMLDGPAPTLDFEAGADTGAFARVLLRIGDVLLVGGDFEGIKPTRFASPTDRPFLAALNAVTGQPVSTFQVPTEVDSVVRALTLSPDGTQVYAGGDFGLLVLDAATGALDYEIDITNGNDIGRVFAVEVSDTQLYIGGDFKRVNNTYRANLARLSLAGVLDSTWKPKATFGFNNGRAAPVQSLAVSPSGNTVYVGGNFKFIDDTPVSETPPPLNRRISMFALSAVDGSVLPERFSPDVGNVDKGLTAHDIMVNDFYVVVAWGGPNFVSFHSLDGTRLLQYAAKGDVQALQEVGNHVFVGHHGEYFGSRFDPIPPEAVVNLDPLELKPFKIHSFRIDDPSFLPEQAWEIGGVFGVWGISAAEDSLWVAGQIFRAGSNERLVDGLARFPAVD